ncbi:hypothetical protein H0H92_004953 [Tricholoma furcatifolium]|nr:hypothetical protein H0H92_004953 [Tricholoma furcatifolium]
MLDLASAIEAMHPGIFIHSVYIAEDLEDDRKAGFYGNVNEQVALAAEQLAAIPELQGGFDAMGLSQGACYTYVSLFINSASPGGQFLRAYVEQYNSPPVHNLVTFGSQHMGISDIPRCRPYDLICHAASRVVKSAVYSDWAQKNIVQAQYFRDPSNMDSYLNSNHFLACINNEATESRNQTYKKNLASLENLVLVLFTEDETVVPKESSWFGSEAYDDAFRLGEGQVVLDFKEKTIISMRQQPLYEEDWIGLRQLDERGGVVLDTCAGAHMRLGDCLDRLVKLYVGGL